MKNGKSKKLLKNYSIQEYIATTQAPNFRTTPNGCFCSYNCLSVFCCVKYWNFTKFPGVEFCGKAQFPQSVRQFDGNFMETVLSTKLLHQEIRWSFSILRSVYLNRASINVANIFSSLLKNICYNNKTQLLNIGN